MSIDLEYAIKTDIRNNPVLRETDVRERREFRRIVLLASLTVGLVLFSAWQHFELLRHGYRLEQMQRQRAEEEEAGRHLRLEIETLRAPKRIEKLAVDRLRLVAPGPGEAVVIERAVPSEPPDQTVVASR